MLDSKLNHYTIVIPAEINKVKITKLILALYKRLSLKDIKYLEVTPESAFQLILGTNGSGKSSVLDELTVLPANPASFNKGGYKEIHVTHGGADYILKSTFKSSARHSFVIVDSNTELNPGGTITVQKELVAKYFKITPTLHAIMTGRTLFTNMSSVKRSELITSLSDVDMTYALQVFNRIKVSARDNQGAIKHVKSRLATESSKLHELSDIDALDKEIKALTGELNWLFSQSNPHRNKETIDLEGALTSAALLGSRILNAKLDLPDTDLVIKDISDVQQHIHSTTTRLEICNSEIQNLSAEYDKLKVICGTVDENGTSTEGTSTRLKVVKEEIARIPKDNWHWVSPYTLSLEQLNSVRREAGNAILHLHELCVELSGTHRPERATEETLGRIGELRDSQLAEADRLSKKMGHLEYRIKGIESVDSVDCPECHVTFRPGANAITQLVEEMESYKPRLEAIEVAYNDTDKLKREIQTYLGARRAILDLFTRYNMLSPFFEALMGEVDILENPDVIARTTSLFAIALDNVSDYTALHSEQGQLEQTLKIMEGLDLSSGLSPNLQLEVIDNKLAALLESKNHYSAQIRDWGNYLNSYNSLIGMVNNLADEIANYKELTNLRIEQVKGELVDDALQVSQLRMSSLSRRQTEHTTLTGVVADLELDLTGTEKDLELIKILGEVLSPNTGLIAEQLLGFINCFVAQMNDIIKQCWTYDLTVLPCGNTNGNLDYKFPITVRTPDNKVSDVSEGSTAQKEIVNFAFMLVVMLYSDLNNYPLYLDEFGAGFDEAHRVNAMAYVKLINDTGRHSQTFMISHYATNHGSFRSAEVLVLDGDNISVPQGYNKHVVLR